LRAGERETDIEADFHAHPGQLVSVDDIWERTRRVEDAQRDGAADCNMVAQHRAQRHDARAAADEEQRTAELFLPDEVAA
jgi:hypothetical protein